MAEEKSFERKDFDRIIVGLLRSKPLPKKNLGTSKQAKMGRVIPRLSRPPKSSKATEA